MPYRKSGHESGRHALQQGAPRSSGISSEGLHQGARRGARTVNYGKDKTFSLDYIDKLVKKAVSDEFLPDFMK